jgi:hypothetical protein
VDVGDVIMWFRVVILNKDVWNGTKGTDGTFKGGLEGLQPGRETETR